MSGTPELRLVDETRLTELATRALQACGLDAADAAAAARILVLADLFGLDTNGVSRLKSYGARLRSGGINARAAIRAERKSAAIFIVDGDNGVGPLVGTRALEAAMAAARETGVGVAFARGSNHFGPIAPYAYIAAQQGFASIIGSNASATMAPSGGSDARVANNPLGFCVPRPGADPVLLDMAMSVVARAKIRRARDRGESIPETWATDGAGRPTTDPRAALAGFLQPIGGYKGYGLALMVDLFAGLLSGASYLTHVKSWIDEPAAPQGVGHFFILIDVAALGLPDLAARIADFAAIVQGSPPIDPASPVRLPGEREFARMARQRRDGISLDAGVLGHLEAMPAANP